MTKINQRVALVWKGYRNIKLYAQLIHKEGIAQAQQLPSLDLLPPSLREGCPALPKLHFPDMLNLLRFQVSLSNIYI